MIYLFIFNYPLFIYVLPSVWIVQWDRPNGRIYTLTKIKMATNADRATIVTEADITADVLTVLIDQMQNTAAPRPGYSVETFTGDTVIWRLARTIWVLHQTTDYKRQTRLTLSPSMSEASWFYKHLTYTSSQVNIWKIPTQPRKKLLQKVSQLILVGFSVLYNILKVYQSRTPGKVFYFKMASKMAAETS